MLDNLKSMAGLAGILKDLPKIKEPSPMINMTLRASVLAHRPCGVDSRAARPRLTRTRLLRDMTFPSESAIMRRSRSGVNRAI